MFSRPLGKAETTAVWQWRFALSLALVSETHLLLEFGLLGGEKADGEAASRRCVHPDRSLVVPSHSSTQFTPNLVLSCGYV